MTESTTAQWEAEARLLCAGLREQREIYGELESHTRRQGEILLAGLSDEILALARDKESTLERIEVIETRIAPAKARWHSDRDQLSTEVRAEVQAELDALHQILGDLIALESEQQRRVEEVRLETADKLKKIDGGRRVNQAYGATPQGAPSPRYLDRTE